VVSHRIGTVTAVAIGVQLHPYGDAAFEALARIVRGAKDADPFSPVTVLVDSGGLALALRRRLAARPPGVVHLRCTTWGRLAAELAAEWLSSGARTVASPAIELEAVRSVLAREAPARFAAAVDQPATLRALARTFRDLAGVPDHTLGVLGAQSPRAADVIDVVRRVRAALSGCAGASELFSAAAAEVWRRGEWAAELCGTVAVHLPGRVGAAEIGLLEALGGCTGVEVVVGLTGDVQADQRARELVSRLSGLADAVVTPDAGSGSGAQVPLPTWVRSAPSADAEVLMALRHLMERNARGVPLERMALVHGGAPLYRQLVHDVVASAGVPAYGRSVRSLASTVTGRALLGALGLGDHDWRRDEVVAWITSAPLLHEGHLVPAADWDVLSAQAGVVSGLDQWRERLGSQARALREQASVSRRFDDEDLVGDADAFQVVGEGDGGASDGGASDGGASDGGASDGGASDGGASRSSCRASRLEIDARRCDELRAFLDRLAGRLSRVPDSWAGWAEWATDLLAELLGGATRRAGWPQEEIVAFDAVHEALGRIGALDRVGGSAPNAVDFRTALGAELDAPAPATTRFGHGLLVGHIHEAIGLDLDVVCVVGMVDGAFPAPRGDDVLLPNRERAGAASDVPLREHDAADSRRDFLAALASARERVLSCARYDQRHGRELRPARALLQALEALESDGRRISARELAIGPTPSLAGGRFQFVASFAEAVRDAEGRGEPVSDADWCVRSLTRWVAAGRAVCDHFLVGEDEILATALLVRRDRRSERFTRFDGLVEHLEIPSPLAGVVQSATGLESFARCPRRYYFSHLLGVVARQGPETVLQLVPAERGLLVHRVLERLVAEEITRRSRNEPDVAEDPTEDPTEDHGAEDPTEDPAAREARMLAYVEEEVADAQRRGVTGHPALWALERSRIVSDLREHLRADAELRAATGERPVAVELHFGPTSGTDVVVETPKGPVRFRGRLDRVDELAGGWLAVVDYKSGKRHPPQRDGDPLSGGTRLQLPLYALAAKAAYGAERKVRAGYWFVGSPTPPEWLTLDDALEERLAQVVGTLSETIGAGRFPARPGPSDGRGDRGINCAHCPYDAMCPPDRAPAWRRKRSDPALGAYVALVGET